MFINSINNHILKLYKTRKYNKLKQESIKGFDFKNIKSNYVPVFRGANNVFSKGDLYKKLEKMTNSDGSFKFTNLDISNILNCENNISEINAVVDMIQKRGIEFEHTDFVKYLSREDFDFELEKEKFAIIDELANSSEYDFFKNENNFNFNDICLNILKGCRFLTSEQYISNIILVKKVYDFIYEKTSKEVDFEYLFKTFFKSILSNAKLKPDDFDSLVNSGLIDDIDNIDDIYNFNCLFFSNVDENLDISKRIKFIKQIKEKTSLLDDKEIYYSRLANILELDLSDVDEIKDENFEFYNKNISLIKNLNFEKQIKILASKNIFDKNTQEFLNFASDRANKFDKLDYSKFLYMDDVDFEKLLNILKEIKENKLQSYFGEDFAKNFEKYGQEKIELSIKKAKLFQKYPKLFSMIPGSTFEHFIEFFADDTVALDEFNKRLKKIDEFVDKNSKILKKSLADYKISIVLNSLFAPDFSLACINNDKKVQFASLFTDKMNNRKSFLYNKLLYQTAGAILLGPEFDNLAKMKNFEKNFVYTDELLKLFETDEDVYFLFGKQSLLDWLMGDFDLKEVIEKIKYTIKHSKAPTIEVDCDDDSFYINKDYGARETVRKYDKNAKAVFLKQRYYGVLDNPDLRMTKLKEKNMQAKIIEEYCNEEQMYYPIEIIKQVKDINNKSSYLEKTAFSDIEGVLNIERIYPNGTTEVISRGEKTENCSIITKNFTSLDGTKTEVEYKSDNNGNYTQTYKIYSQNGDTLLSDFKSRRLMSDNSVLTIHNDKKYKIRYRGFIIFVFDLNENKEISINLKTLTNSKAEAEALMKLLKSIDGWELFSFIKNVKKFELKKKLKSDVDLTNRTMSTGMHKFVFEHELGHIKDISYNTSTKNSDYQISADRELIEIYNCEKENFLKALSTIEKDASRYFFKVHEDGAIRSNPLSEVTAEVNAILNSSIFQRQLAFRSYYLQAYFPRTIAYLAGKLD